MAFGKEHKLGMNLLQLDDIEIREQISLISMSQARRKLSFADYLNHIITWFIGKPK
jgi:hypothetical protein